MFKRLFAFAAIFGGLSLALAVSTPAQESAPTKASAPATSKSLVEAAQQKAKKQHKPMMVRFDASW